ncbi:MAG: tetratricopeptide repeat protein [Bacteroidota bacterium]
MNTLHHSNPHRFISVFFTLAVGLSVLSGTANSQESDQIASVAELLKTARLHIETDIAAADSIATLAYKRSLTLNVDSLISRSCYTLGLVNYYNSRFFVSSEYYKKALAREYAAVNKEFTGSCWNNLGINYDMTDQYSEAIKAYLNSLHISEALGDSLSIHQSYINLGLLFIKTEDYLSAQENLLKARSYFSRINDEYDLALSHQNIGILFVKQGKMDLALRSYTEAIRLYEKMGEKKEAGAISVNIISALLDWNVLSGIEQRLHETAEKYRPIGDEIINGTLDLQFARVELILKRYASAERHLRAAERAFIAMNTPSKLLEVYSYLLRLYVKNGSTQQYEELFRRYNNLSNSIYKREPADVIAEYQLIHEDERKAEHIKYLSKEVQNKNKIILLWFLLSIVAVISTVVMLKMYLNIRQQQRALFERNMELSFAMAREVNIPDVPEVMARASGETNFLKLYRELNERVTKNKLYLKSDLSVLDIAELLNTNEKYISKSLSEGFGNNFSRYINTLRINDAKLILIDPEHDHLTYDQIADKVGFNNQFTFQRQFKELTGLTPTSFRKSNRN